MAGKERQGGHLLAAVNDALKEEEWHIITKLPQIISTKSRDWLEAECLSLARRTIGGSEIQRVMIRRLRTQGTGPNWKVADIIPQPSLLTSDNVRAALASLRTHMCLKTRASRMKRIGTREPCASGSQLGAPTDAARRLAIC
jgi:hypothetical protein